MVAGDYGFSYGAAIIAAEAEERARQGHRPSAPCYPPPSSNRKSHDDPAEDYPCPHCGDPNCMVERGLYAHAWQYNNESPSWGDYIESICCPCVVYGRAYHHLKIICNEHHGKYIKERAAPLLSPACCWFASCLPFYGCLIEDIRRAVREYYIIEGDTDRDYAMGCMYPSETLMQIENEILLREDRARKEPDCTGYIPHPPMTYPSSSSSTSQATTPNTDRDEPLPRIPEEGSTATSSSIDTHRTRTTRRRARSIARDPVAPTDATLVNAHELSQDPTTPAMDKGHSAPHRLSKEDLASLTHRLPPSDTGHDLHHDPAARVKSPSPTAHRLEDDVNASPRRSPPSNAHHLQHDAVNSRAKSPRPHTLEADESVPSRSAGPGPHHLQHDK